MPQHCLNCDHVLIADAQHCSQCGQKVVIRQLSFWTIVSDFFSNLFNFETKIWRTLRDIWIPAQLTIAFVSGKRVSYYNPIRIFIICLFAFFALYLYNINDSFNSIEETVNSKKKEIWTLDLIDDYDSLSNVHNWPKEINDKIKSELLLPLPIKGEQITIDTLNESIRYVNPSLKDSIEESADTIEYYESGEVNLGFSSEDDLVKFNLGQGKIIDNISINDLFRLSPEDLTKKAQDKSWLNKILILQLQKVVVNLSSMLKFFIGNGTWLAIAVILLISAFFKLLYWRYNYLYAEHFIFHVYGHTRLLLLAIVGILFEIFLLDNSIWTIPLIFVGSVYLFLSMRRFYKQSLLKTTFKFLLTLFIYLLLLVLCVLVLFGLSFLIF
jgi:hypothetical protein